MQIKKDEKIANAVPVKTDTGKGDFDQIIQQNNFTNLALHSLGNQTSRIEEILCKPKQILSSRLERDCSKTIMIKPPPNL